MKRIFTIIFSVLVISSSYSQKTKTEKIERPKLVVGIVVDQMRYDYLTRFYDKYSDGGFKRLLHEGFNLENAHYNYIPTYTAVGHTSIYTGTTPQNHGIISNWWYDKYLKKSIYCVDDSTYTSIGAPDGGRKSPKRLLTTTVTDELKMAQSQQGKVIGISIKDRSAILPTGHTADAAYWFQGKNEGKFITSSYYKDDLPRWVKKFNASGKAKKYLNTTWNTLYNIDTYTESIEDDNKFETLFIGKETATFPYDLKKLKKHNGNYNLISTVPFGNSLIKDFAEAAIIGEQLGQDAVTDFLAVSFSSTDYVGHRFGVDSKEVQDTYLRLDRDLASFLKFLDEKIGATNYTLFLTADHAAVQVPSYLQTIKIPAGYFDIQAFRSFLSDFTKEEYGSDKLIENISNFQIFINKQKVKELKLNLHQVTQKIADKIIDFDGVYKVVTAKTLQSVGFNHGILKLLQNGYNQKFSGDVLVVPNPSTITYSKTGSTHGSGYAYDTHVPIIFYGKGIKKGNLKRYVPITDIAPTLANLLKISFPNGSTGTVIPEVFDR